MPNWWEYKTLAPTKPQQQPQQQGGGGGGFGAFTGVVGDVLKQAVKPVDYVGKGALTELGKFDRRFVAPTTAWLMDAIADFEQIPQPYLKGVDTGIYGLKAPIKPMFGRRRELFGSKLPENNSGVNPLKAWSGDDTEIEKAEAYLSQVHPLLRVVMETVADPTNWLTLGTGAAGRGLVKSGALMIGRNANDLDSITDARQVMQGILGNEEWMAMFGKAIGSAEHNQAAKALILSGVLMKTFSGIPEIMMDTFLKTTGKGLKSVAYIPRLKVEEINGAPRLRMQLVNAGEISVRSSVDRSLKEAADLMRQTRQHVALEVGDDLTIPDLEAATIRRLMDPNLDTSNFTPLAQDAYRQIHSGNIALDDLYMRAQEAGDDIFDITYDLHERLAKSKIKKYGLFPTDKEAADAMMSELPNWQRAIAKVTNMQNGYRFFENKLARTFLHGVLFSPWYVMQNGITDPLFAGTMRMGMRPDLAKPAFGNVFSSLYSQLLARTGTWRRAGAEGFNLDQPLEVISKQQEELFEASRLGQVQFGVSHRTGGGYIVETADRLADFVAHQGRVGNSVAKAIRVGATAPQAAAAAFDEGYFRSVWEIDFTRRLRSTAAYGSNPEVARMVSESDEFFKMMEKAGVNPQQAKAASMAYLTAFSDSEFMDKMRQISNSNPADILNYIPVDESLILPQELQKELATSVRNLWSDGREGLSSGKKVSVWDPKTKARKEVEVHGIDYHKRVTLPKIVKDRVISQREPMKMMIDDLIDSSVTSRSAALSMHDLVDNVYNATNKLEDKVIGLMTAANATARDVEFYGDTLMRLMANKQAINRFITEASAAVDINSITKWSRARPKTNLAIARFNSEMEEYIDAAIDARKSLLKGDKKAYGDFRAKYDQSLPQDPDLDTLNTLMDSTRAGVNKYSTDTFNEFYKLFGLQGGDIGMEARYFQGVFNEIDNYTRQAMEISDNWLASQDNLLRVANDMVQRGLPHSNKETMKELLELNNKTANKSMDVAMERMGDFYLGNTNLDEMLMWMFPFARFGLRAIPLSARAVSRAPGMVPMFARWQHEADKQMTFPPGWLPLIGNIHANPLSAMAPYQLFEGLTDPRVYGSSDIETLTQTLGRSGLAPGPGLMAILGNLGQAKFEGTVVPGQRGLGLLQALNVPGAELPPQVLNNISQVVYNSPGNEALLDRETQRVLIDMGLDPAEVSPESPEWDRARKEALAQGAWNYFVPGTRYIDEQRVQWAQQEAEAFAAVGIPTEEQIALRRNQESPWNKINEEQRDKVIGILGEEEYRRHLHVAPARLDTRALQNWHAVQSYYVLQTQLTKTRDDEILLAGQALLNDEISGADYRRKKADAWLTYSAGLEAQKRSVLARVHGADVLDPQLVSTQQANDLFEVMRNDIRRSGGKEIVETTFPEDEALDAYQSITPANYENPLTGEIDWDVWENDRAAFLALQTPAIREYIERVRERRITRDPVEELYEQAKTQMSEYQTIPRYLGISPQDQETAYEGVQAVRALESIGMERKQALFTVQRQFPKQAILARIALKRPNPFRSRYWDAHPLLAKFFSNDIVPTEFIQQGV